jgi:ComF family protein
MSGVWSRWQYAGPVRKIVHALKYQGRVSLVDWLADEMAPALAHFSDWVMHPVPSTRAKMAKRGYNQSELLARALAAKTGLQYACFLARHSHTTSQTKLSREERFVNVRGQITPRCRIPPNTKIILIDDVLTTGATLTECARVLRESGAADIWAVTIAKD